MILKVVSCCRIVFNRTVARAIATTMVDYKSTVDALNNLQSNAMTLKIISNSGSEKEVNVHRTITCLNRIGLSVDDLDSLSIIHVSGTKGKGSTCAFTESILRAHGYKTGFYSSPHLIEVRERIRINGVPLSKEVFTSYFWTVYDRLEKSKEADDNYMPSYFKFLTVLAFYIFFCEKVDVSIIEVGIGGTYDCTNAIRNPVACGISSLGLDHTAILGKTIEEIAWHKAGIMKPGTSAFTAPQVDSAITVLQEQSNKVKAALQIVPPLSSYPGTEPKLGIDGEVQKWNASLAIQLANTWLEKNAKQSKTHNGDQQLQTGKGLPTASTFPLSENFKAGLQSCVWNGRYQMMKYDGATFYFDGAHTRNSIQARTAVEWFHNKSTIEATNIRGSVARILIFNLSGNRDSKTLLKPIINTNIDYAIFSPNILKENHSSPDTVNRNETTNAAMQRCNENLSAWMELNGLSNPTNSRICGSVNEAISVIKAIHKAKSLNYMNDKTIEKEKKYIHLQILVTGSLHLVGDVLQVLQTTQF
ncbi:Folylpolyglutamate synthase, mitochondrial [Trichoplax sp. H2]|nr:Folylpolyglutamate synthase, mitochondrial [Trichoplax sp. H2]|eukprot:RDD38678.1 Folylpolyglutamate synthase, mitochondrial [Trichoplax sp. H2]